MTSRCTLTVVACALLWPFDGAPAQAGNRSSSAHAIVGTWRFVRYQTWDATGVPSTPFGAVPAGYIVFDANGIAVVQLSTRLSATDTTQDVSFGAYYGTYTIDPGDTVRIKVEGANFSGYTGTTQVRPFRIARDTLYLGVPRAYQATLVRVRPAQR